MLCGPGLSQRQRFPSALVSGGVVGSGLVAVRRGRWRLDQLVLLARIAWTLLRDVFHRRLDLRPQYERRAIGGAFLA
jgi:hypothetical protein